MASTTPSPFFGGTKGSQVDLNCPNNTYVTSVTGRTGTYPMAIELTCSDGSRYSAGNNNSGTKADVLTCNTGFQDFGVHYSSTVVNQAQFSCGNRYLTLGTPAGSADSWSCPGDKVLSGMTVRSGDQIYNMQFHCSAVGKCSNPQTILDGYCESYCSDPVGSQACSTTVSNFCDGKMTTNEQCRTYINTHPGMFDTLMNKYCATPEALAQPDPLCWCYVPFQAEGLSQSTIDYLKANPQCWNSNCVSFGYRNANLVALTGTCPEVQIQNCIQTTNVTVNGQVQGDVSVKETADCSQYAGGDDSGGTEWWVWLLIILGLFVLITVGVVAANAASGAINTKKQGASKKSIQST